MSQAELIAVAKDRLKHFRAGTMALDDEVFSVPAHHYFDEQRFRVEVDRIFRRIPLLLAPSVELPNPGDYKAMSVCGTPIVLVRNSAGEIRAYFNSCNHRGTCLVDDGNGNTKRFACPYHGWTFDLEGELTAIVSEGNFGEIDKSKYGLVSLPVTERAGLIWCTLNPHSNVDFDAFLAGYDDLLAEFGFETWHLFQTRTLRGPNWKIAYDGYLDFYHLPVLHRTTFPDIPSNKGNYYAWGPHQRLVFPDIGLDDAAAQPESEWSKEFLLDGVWTIFPHISIASFDGGGRGVMLSQLFPGATPGESFTTQFYLMENAPSDELEVKANEQFALLKYVVESEDYATGLRQQQALEAGVRDHVLFGRNESGGRHFHQWVKAIIEADDQQLPQLFEALP